jgi:two-component system sensor histidine kinase VicK
MRDYQYKIILAFFVVGIVIILGLGLCYAFIPNISSQHIIGITSIALILYTIGGVMVAIITQKKIIDPMSRMLKSATELTEEDKNNQKDYIDPDVVIKGLRESLREANEQKIQIDTILYNMTDGVISFDMDGKVGYINDAAKRMLGLKNTDDSFLKIFSNKKESFSDLDINLEKIVYLDNLASSEVEVKLKQNYLKIFFVPIKDESNRATGLMAVIQDITEHVNLDNMRKDFVADVSHELRTPLTSIMGFSETLANDDVDKEMAKHFEQEIYENAERMQNLVNDLLILSKYDQKTNNVITTDFDIGELTKKCKETFDIELEKKDIKCECMVTADIPPIHADKTGIERVILNIISNSVKYTPEGGSISIYVGSIHNDAYIKIKDTGIGIPKDSINKVFERFYRVDKARSRQIGGTGLGLPIAKEIIEQNNGSITLTSELNKGTEVVIRIPIKKEDTNER